MSEKKYVVIPFENAEDAAAFINFDPRQLSGFVEHVAQLRAARLLDADEYPTRRHQGWTNYETWAVKLWMDNDEGSYNYWKDAAQEAYSEAKADDILTRGQRARYNLADRLKNQHEAEAESEDLGTGVYSDLLNSALSEVNWDEIAESLSEEVDRSEAEEETEESPVE